MTQLVFNHTGNVHCCELMRPSCVFFKDFEKLDQDGFNQAIASLPLY